MEMRIKWLLTAVKGKDGKAHVTEGAKRKYPFAKEQKRVPASACM